MSYAPIQSPMTAGSHPSTEMSSLQVPNVHRHRKAVSTGGGRAWSDAEEAYLIETREHKMPYKHIAAQLKKTELACRLHYHQLSFGSKSRRTPSLASVHSMDRSSMTPPASLRHPTPQRALPSFSPPESPDQSTTATTTKTTTTKTTTPSTISNTSDPSTSTTLPNKPILPRPNIPSDGAGAGGYHHHHHHSSPKRLLRLNTSPPSSSQRNAYVDLALLDRIYDAHRLHFWSTIASAYGGNLSPASLEDAWRRHHGLMVGAADGDSAGAGAGTGLPPTPRGSPGLVSSASSSTTTTTTNEGPGRGERVRGSFSAVTDPGQRRGFTAVNRGASGSGGRASEPPAAHHHHHQQQQQQQQQAPRSAYPGSRPTHGAGFGSIRSLLNGGEMEEGVSVEQGRKLREIEREYGDAVARRGSREGTGSEGSTPTAATGQMEVVGAKVVETTA